MSDGKPKFHPMKSFGLGFISGKCSVYIFKYILIYFLLDLLCTMNYNSYHGSQKNMRYNEMTADEKKFSKMGHQQKKSHLESSGKTADEFVLVADETTDEGTVTNSSSKNSKKQVRPYVSAFLTKEARKQAVDLEPAGLNSVTIAEPKKIQRKKPRGTAEPLAAVTLPRKLTSKQSDNLSGAESEAASSETSENSENTDQELLIDKDNESEDSYNFEEVQLQPKVPNERPRRGQIILLFTDSFTIFSLISSWRHAYDKAVVRQNNFDCCRTRRCNQKILY